MSAVTAAPAVTGASVVVRDLHKSFGTVKAVDGVNLRIEPGEFVALLGPSGSGKTTILMCIAGFESPDAGDILIGDTDITPVPPHRRGIGMVFQKYALFPHMTVADNIAFPLRMRHVDKAERAGRVERALELVRLGGYGSRRTNQLSGGQQQRVALARAIVFDPPVLLMDEPLGALDKRLREEMQIELKHIQQQLKTTVVYVTHDQAEALTMADRIAVLSDGVVQQYASPAEVYERPANSFVAGFVGETNFIDGRLERDGAAGPWRFASDAGPVSLGTEPEPGWTDGMAARIAIRPESIDLVEVGTPGSLEGTVLETIYGGGTVACVLELAPGLHFTVREATGRGPVRRRGDRAGVIWAADRGRVFAR